MILEHAVLSVIPARTADFEANLRDALPLIESAPGCHGAEVRRQVEDPSTYLLLVRWDSVDAHMAFRASDRFPRWKELTHPFYDPFPTVTHFTEPVTRVVGDVVTDAELVGFVRRGPRDKKWSHAVQIFAGSPTMPGAADLVVRGAMAGGASMVRLAPRGNLPSNATVPPEAVYADHLDDRCVAVAAGPGLGPDCYEWLSEKLLTVSVPVVLDADALRPDVVALRPATDTWVLTPHGGEFARLTGEEPSLNAARTLAASSGCVVLLKGPETVVAHPDGRHRVVTSGTEHLATAGSGDVLTGLIVGALASGHEPFAAAFLSAHLHGLAGQRLTPHEGAGVIANHVREILSSFAQ